MSVDDASPYVKILVYGRNGAGKTRFAASAPKCLIIDINESGTESTIGSGADVFHAKKWEDIVYAYWFLKQGDHKYESVALDTLTQMQAMCMSHVLKEAADRDPNRDPKLPVQRDWNKITELIRPQILNFKNLPMHVIFTAQERPVTNEEGEVEEIGIDMSRANRGNATGAANIIGRLYKREVRVAGKKGKEIKKWETRMLVGPHDEYITKDRSNALGRIMRNPTVPEIIRLREEKLKKIGVL